MPTIIPFNPARPRPGHAESKQALDRPLTNVEQRTLLRGLHAVISDVLNPDGENLHPFQVVGWRRKKIQSFPTEAEARAAADQLAAATGWDRVTVESLVGVVYQVVPQEKP